MLSPIIDSKRAQHPIIIVSASTSFDDYQRIAAAYSTTTTKFPALAAVALIEDAVHEKGR